MTESGCIPNVVDDYSNFLASGQLSTDSITNGGGPLSILTSSTTSFPFPLPSPSPSPFTSSSSSSSIIHSQGEGARLKTEENTVDGVTSVTGKKKKRKGLGKKKNRKNKKSKSLRSEETSDAGVDLKVSRRSHEFTDAQDRNLPTGQRQSEQINSEVQFDLARREEKIKRSNFFSNQNE